MQTLSDAEMTTLRTELQGSAYAGLSDVDAWNLLHRPDGTQPNPVTSAPLIAAPVYESNLLGLLTDPANGSLGKVFNWPNFGLLKADIDTQNRPSLIRWAESLAAVGIITAGEASAIISAINSQISDPAWTATIPGLTPCVKLFGGKTWHLGGVQDGATVDYIPLEDVEAARA